MGGLWTVTRGAEIRQKGKRTFEDRNKKRRKNREISEWLREPRVF